VTNAEQRTEQDRHPKLFASIVMGTVYTSYIWRLGMIEINIVPGLRERKPFTFSILQGTKKIQASFKITFRGCCCCSRKIPDLPYHTSMPY
jgi:hypothetical protein